MIKKHFKEKKVTGTFSSMFLSEKKEEHTSNKMKQHRFLALTFTVIILNRYHKFNAFYEIVFYEKSNSVYSSI